MSSASLAIVITNSAYLHDAHLEWQIDALNRQSSRDFCVYYLNQARDTKALERALKGALFPYQYVHLPFPWLAETCCWDLVSVVGQLMQQLRESYWTYLHKECLPAPGFVEQLLQGIAQAEQDLGPDCIFRVNQLRCRQSFRELDALYPATLAASQPVYWIKRTPFAPRYTYQEAPWEEDAFVLSTELTRRTRLLAPRFPLFFQDLFDIFYQLPQIPALAQIKQVHLGHPVIYHLNHPRVFREYRQAFLNAVRQHPRLFGHLALFELAAEPFDYREDLLQGERVIAESLHRFVRYMRYAERGTVTLWVQAIQAALERKGN